MHQLFIEALIGVGFALDGLVLEGTGVELIKLGLGFRHGLLEHAFAIGGFLELEVDALPDVGAQGSELTFQLGDLGEGFLVLGVVGAVLGFDAFKLLVSLIEAVGEAAELFALGGGLRGLEGFALDGIGGGQSLC